MFCLLGRKKWRYEYDQHLARCTLARNNLELSSSLEGSSCTDLPGVFPRQENILRYATCLASRNWQRFDSCLQTFLQMKQGKSYFFVASPCFGQIRIGGCMHELVRCGYFGLGGVKLRLQRATASLRQFCKTIGRRTALHKFSQDNLCLKKGQFPETLWICKFSSVFGFQFVSPV